MHDELLQFQRNDVWTLVPRPEGEHIIGTKWIFRNKTDKKGNVIRNKARLVAQGYSQMKEVDYDETFALVARMKSIRILLALACHLKFKLYQMDIKTTFLNVFLKGDVYVAQPKGFIDPHFLDHVLYLKKTLYGLKQAPRAWYDRLTQYLVSHGFTRGKVDQTLFIKREDDELIVAQVYVDDIIFGSTKDELAHSFLKLMQAEFKMSMIGELTHFLGLQIRQQDSGIFLSQSKYERNLVKKFGLESASFVRTLISPIEVEYIAVGSCCTPLLWMQKLFHDHSICQEHLTIYCDNTNAINISKNPVQHSRTKHIEIQHHFVRELVEDDTLTLEFIHTNDQRADLFTKPLDSKWFEFLRQNLGVISID